MCLILDFKLWKISRNTRRITEWQMNIVLYCTLEMHEEYWIGFWFSLRSNLEAISIALWKHLNENYHRKLEQKNVFSVKLSQRKVWIWREHFWYSSNFDIIFVHTEINLFKSTSDSLSRVKFQRIECFVLHRAISKVEHFRCYSIVFCHKNEHEHHHDTYGRLNNSVKEQSVRTDKCHLHRRIHRSSCRNGRF